MSKIEAGIKLAKVLREVKLSLFACQLIITDPTARETVRDIVNMADEALDQWEKAE